MKRRLAQAAFMLFGLGAMAGGVAAVVGALVEGTSAGDVPAYCLIGLGEGVLVILAGAALVRRGWRIGLGKSAVPAAHQFTSLGRLRRLYVQNRLARSAPVALEGNPYKDLTHAQLEEVAAAIDPARVPQKVQALLEVIKARVEEAYLPDGRFLPERVRNQKAIDAPEEARCSRHAERAAQRVCPRCGSFFCGDCVAGDRKHCAPCLEVLLAEG